MVKGIVIQLQTEALDESVDIETLLRKAYLVARKLQLKDFEKWASNEQNGYTDNIPEYRIIDGEIKAWNPYHGWIPVVFNGKIADELGKMPIGNPISVICDAYKSNDEAIVFNLSGQLTEILNQNTTAFQTKYSFHSSKTEFRKIISAVRNKILEWAILLEENGIVGDGLSFTEKEKQTALESHTINSYTNNFFATTDNAQIQQGGNNNNQE